MGGYARIDVRNNTVTRLDIRWGQDWGRDSWKLPPDGPDGLFARWCRGQTEQIFRWETVRGLKTYPGHLPLSHMYVIEHLASLKAILMCKHAAEHAYTVGERELSENMLVQLAAVADQAHRLAYNGI